MPRECWFSPYPRFTSRGSNATLEALADADTKIGHMETIVGARFSSNLPNSYYPPFKLSDLKEKRKKARASAVNGGQGGDNLHSGYLTIVENQRRAEVEVNFWLIGFLFQDAYQTEILQLNGLRKERLTLIIIADFAYNPEFRKTGCLLPPS